MSCGMLAQLPPDTTVFQAITQQQIDMQSAVAKGLNQSTETGVIPDFKVDKVFEVSLGNRPESMLRKVSAAEAAELWYLLSPDSAKPL